VLDSWSKVAVLHVDSQLSGSGDAQLGETLSLRAEIALGGLSPTDVRVEAVYGAADPEDRLSEVTTRALEFVGHTDGTSRYEGEIPLDRTGGFGYTVRALPQNPLLASAAELGVVATA
jgi:starch phosphorylase